MAIEAIKYQYAQNDTSVNVTYVESGEEKTMSVDTILVNGVVDFDATESSIVSAVYGLETPPNAPVPVDE